MNKNETSRNKIFGGVVSLIKVVDDSEIIEDDTLVLSNDGKKSVIAIDIRKGVFENISGTGYDLFYSLNRENAYNYKIIDKNTKEFQNNSIVVRDAREFEDILNYIGFPHYVHKSQLSQVRKTVLSGDECIQIQKHTRGICKQGVIHPSRVSKMNEQAASLLEFKEIELPTKPQKVEKVYAKYFK